jgi:hypothetical protein
MYSNSYLQTDDDNSDDGERPQARQRRSYQPSTPEQKRKAHKVIEKRRREKMNRHFEELRELMAMGAPGRARGVCKGDILAAACKYIHEMNEYCKTLYGVNVKIMAERGAPVPEWILTPDAAKARAADIATGRKTNIASTTSATVSTAANRATFRKQRSRQPETPAPAQTAFDTAVRLNIAGLNAATTAAVKFPGM